MVGLPDFTCPSFSGSPFVFLFCSSIKSFIALPAVPTVNLFLWSLLKKAIAFDTLVAEFTISPMLSNSSLDHFFSKRALILELTCPNEDRFETSHVLKEKKYLKLRDSIIANGFDCNIFTIEVGVRGNICMDQLNIWTRHIGSPLAPTKALFCECTRIARQCSYVLFQTRNLPTWHSRPLMRSIKEEPATASFIKDGKEIFPVEEVKIHKVTKLKTIEKLTIERSWLEKFDRVGSNGLGAFGSCPIPDVNFLFIFFFFF